MSEATFSVPPQALLRLQNWLSPAFPNGAYSYSHGLEWAVEVGQVDSRSSLVDWLEADLCYGSGRNEAIFLGEAYRCAADNEQARLAEVAELSAVSRGTAEFAIESSQQAAACLATLRKVWPDRFLDGYVANLVNAGVRLIPLGQTDGQHAIAELEPAILLASAKASDATIDDLGSAAIMVDFASIAHEKQYTRLFRS